ncbi:MAG TPA: thioredoxin family protein, partial [Spirochaetes bacterium]|nr:thioredoxin family protein [Spirochaetota bacterium]
MNYKLHSLIKGWILLLAFTITVGCSSNTSSQEANNEGRKFKAPELVGGKGWLNVKKPLTLKSLKGKVVLLDFWTFCCINCIHVIPDLKYLEKKYGHQLVVIGVHSAKFNNEKDIKNIRQAVLRHEIEHPVVNDADFAIWKSYGVRAWPSLVIIDPEGYVVGYVSGEGQRKLLDRTIAGIIEKHKDKINDSPIALTLEKDKIKSENLYFPGKI